ncbi:MAG: CvpA family protein [Alphaproteobacteria bacterium]|nr:CvpA family protein [Alphaproteobacteria bacterium]
MDNLPISVADLFVGAVLVISAMLAFARGLVREVLSMAAWLGAIAATYFGRAPITELSRQALGYDWAPMVGFVAVFVVSLVALSVAGHAVASMVRGSALNSVDRSLGFLFGLARGGLVVCLAYLVLTFAYPPAEQPLELRQARTLPLIERGAEALRELVPELNQVDPAQASPPGEPSSSQRQRQNSNSSTSGTGGGASQVIDFRAELNRLIAPQAGNAGDSQGGSAAKARTNGYSDAERQQLERLLRSHQ